MTRLSSYAGRNDAGSAANQRPVELSADLPSQDMAALEPTSAVAQYLELGSGLLGGWSMVASGGSFGTETWREVEMREERHALLSEMRRRRGGGLPAPR